MLVHSFDSAPCPGPGLGVWVLVSPCQLPLLCGGISLAVTWDALLLRVHSLECPSLASLPAEDLSMF